MALVYRRLETHWWAVRVAQDAFYGVLRAALVSGWCEKAEPTRSGRLWAPTEG